MKVDVVKTKKAGTKPKWAEDDVPDSDNNAVKLQKKKKVSTKISMDKPTKKVKGEKLKMKAAKKEPKKTSNDEHGASLDKLKEIDPEFYKVTKDHLYHMVNQA